MMSLAAIRQVNREAAERAQEEDLRPYFVSDTELMGWRESDRLPRLPFPNLGYHLPDGMTLLRVFFVDKTGMGRPGEPAYTVPQFLEKLVGGRAYAIVEEGPMQVHIGEFVGEGSEPAEVDLSGHATFPPDGIVKEAQRANREGAS